MIDIIFLVLLKVLLEGSGAIGVRPEALAHQPPHPLLTGQILQSNR